MTAILPYPTGPIELEIDIGAQAAGGRWDDDAWGEAQWNQATGEGAYLDVTCDVSELELTSGASSPDGICTKIAGTTGSFTLHGAQYDPWRGLWPPNVLGPDLPVRIRVRPAEITSAENLISEQASSLEDGTTTGWLAAANNPILSNTQAVAFAGSHALAITSSGGGSPGHPMEITLRDPVAVLAGVGYNVTVPYRAATVGRPAFAIAQFEDSAHNLISGSATQGPTLTDTAASWTVLTIENVIAPLGAAYMQLWLWISDSTAGEVHYIDAVAVTQSIIPADWSPVFNGLTDAWEYDASSATVTVPLVDQVAWLANLTLPALAVPVGAGEAVPARIARILTAAGWTGPTDLTASQSPISCIATDLEGAPWDQIGLAADTDLGIVWVDRAGAVAFRPMAQAGQSWTPDATGITLTDTDPGPGFGTLCAVNYMRANPEVVRNIVSIAHALAPPDSGSSTAQIARNDASVKRYGPKSYERSDLICDADSWCALVAGAILMGDAFPYAHPEGADLDIRVDAAVAYLLLSSEIGDLIDLEVSGVVHPCIIVGYTVALTRRALTGTLIVTDSTRYSAGRWDSGGWDTDNWGV